MFMAALNDVFLLNWFTKKLIKVYHNLYHFLYTCNTDSILNNIRFSAIFSSLLNIRKSFVRIKKTNLLQPVSVTQECLLLYMGGGGQSMSQGRRRQPPVECFFLCIKIFVIHINQLFSCVYFHCSCNVQSTCIQV